MKNLWLLLLLAFAPMMSKAQQNDVRFGFETSPFISWLSSDWKPVKSDGANIGFQIFMNAEFYFREYYAIKSGLGISFRNGGRLQYTEGGIVFPNSTLTEESFRMVEPNGSVRYKLQYVEIPFAFKMRTQEIGYMRYYAEIPMFTLGLCTQARGDLGVDNGDNENIGPDTRWLNLSWGFGGGVEYSLTSSTSLIGGLYFQQGFTNVIAKSDANAAKTELNKLVLRIGLMF